MAEIRYGIQIVYEINLEWEALLLYKTENPHENIKKLTHNDAEHSFLCDVLKFGSNFYIVHLSHSCRSYFMKCP